MTADQGARTPHPDELWWRSAVVYQVYPRSFADSNGDGVGDLRGLITHLDHIAGLGVDVLWISPVFPSPQADNGYDISDYQGIDPLFGTLADLDDLIAAVHERGMRVILDLVVNHTSDEHPWFIESRQDRHGPKADWYFWRDARPGTVPGQPGSEPNNWGAVFSGSAWQWSPERGQYYLHLFATKQPDLNWENPEVRAAVFAMMNWWLDRGIDGFRMDVINFISKDPALPDGPITPSGYGDGMPYFSYGPRIHAYLAEMRAKVFTPRPRAYLTVGEMPGVTPQQAREFTDAQHGQLDMVFQFEHVSLDHDGDKWTPKPFRVADLRETLSRWQVELGDAGWNSLYWNNHDQPRVVSRFGDDTRFWYESATALAIVLHLHRGTPYIFQGEEIGMTNAHFDDIGDFRDIESLQYYEHRVGTNPDDADEALRMLRRTSRDNARTPMQWNGDRAAGFTSGTPWIEVNPNHTWLNAARQRADPNSIYHLYRHLIELRHTEPIVVRGDFALLDVPAEDVYAFRRRLDGREIRVVANLSGVEASIDHVGLSLDLDQVILGNRKVADRRADRLAPWEARIHLLEA